MALSCFLLRCLTFYSGVLLYSLRFSWEPCVFLRVLHFPQTFYILSYILIFTFLRCCTFSLGILNFLRCPTSTFSLAALQHVLHLPQESSFLLRRPTFPLDSLNLLRHPIPCSPHASYILSSIHSGALHHVLLPLGCPTFCPPFSDILHLVLYPLRRPPSCPPPLGHPPSCPPPCPPSPWASSIFSSTP